MAEAIPAGGYVSYAVVAPAGSQAAAAPAAAPNAANTEAILLQLKHTITQMEMVSRMNAVSGVDAKGKVFTAYVDALPKDDVATRKGYFTTFLGAIDKADADAIKNFLAHLPPAS